MTGGPGASGPRRFLIAAAVAEHTHCAQWDRPGLAEARQAVIDLFTGELGYTHHSDLGLNPTKTQLMTRLRAFCRETDRREDDLVAIYLSCHGEVLEDGARHVLLPADADPDDIPFTSLATRDLARVILEETRVRRALLLIDACYAGAGGHQVAEAAMDHLGIGWSGSPGSGLVVISAAQPFQQAQAGTFPQLLKNAVGALPVAGHAPEVLAIPAVVAHMNSDPMRPEYQRIGLTMLGLTGEAPEFFANPRHDPQLNEVDLAVQQAAQFAEQDRLREIELTRRLLVRAMAYHGEEQVPRWWFTGRHTALRDLAEWANHAPGQDATACCVVTGHPGSGKTAVLGLIATLSHPERRRTVPLDTLGLPHDLIEPDAVDLAVYAQNLTDTEVLTALAARARTSVGTVGELLEALSRQERSRPFTALIDGLDEAATPESLCATILRPLIEHSRGRIRLLLGTRAYLLTRLGLDLAHENVLDLDSDRYADPDALTSYSAQVLIQARRTSPYRDEVPMVRPVAAAVAQAAGTSFLVARITASTLAAAETVVDDPNDPVWLASLPWHASQAMSNDLHQRLGPDAQRAMDLLRPLAYAQGQGLPWEDIWAPIASEIAGCAYSDEDLLWLRQIAGSYVVEANDNNRSAYRLYHQAMAEHLREQVDDRAAHTAYTRVLTQHVPYNADGTRDYARAHPYTLAHLAYHAAQAGALDEILIESEYLVQADARSLTPHLHQAGAKTARLNAAIYRTSIGEHSTASATLRRQVLAIDAARGGAEALRRQLTSRLQDNWIPQWATGASFTTALRDKLGNSPGIRVVACTYLARSPVAITGGNDNTARIWDLRTGQQIGEPLGHVDWVTAVTCVEIDDTSIAITAEGIGESSSKTVRVWDLESGYQIRELSILCKGEISRLACVNVDESPVVVSVSWDNVAQVWDLHNGTQVCRPLKGHTGTVVSVACAEAEGVPLAVTGGDDHTARVWNLRTGQQIGQPLTGHTDTIRAVACTEVDGTPVAVTGSLDHTARVWNLCTGEQICQPLIGHTDTIQSVACAEVDGVPVVVTGSADWSARVWNLRTGQQIGQPLMGHASWVSAVACIEVDGAPLAVTVSELMDRFVRVWDLRPMPAINLPGVGHTSLVTSVACTEVDDVPVAVTTSQDGTSRVWELESGAQIGDPLIGHEGWVHGVVCLRVDGVPTAITFGSSGDGRIWNLRTRRQTGELQGASKIGALACAQIDGAPFVVTTHAIEMTARVWDVRTQRKILQPLAGHTNWVVTVACTEIDGVPAAVTGSLDSTLRIWNLRTGQQMGPVLTGHRVTVDAVDCAELDGTPIAVSCGGADMTARIWNLRTGQQIGLLHSGGDHAFTAVTCTTIGDLPVAVTISNDNMVRTWNLRTCNLVAEELFPGPSDLAASAEGLVVAFEYDVAFLTWRNSTK